MNEKSPESVFPGLLIISRLFHYSFIQLMLLKISPGYINIKPVMTIAHCTSAKTTIFWE